MATRVTCITTWAVLNYRKLFASSHLAEREECNALLLQAIRNTEETNASSASRAAVANLQEGENSVPFFSFSTDCIAW